MVAQPEALSARKAALPQAFGNHTFRPKMADDEAAPNANRRSLVQVGELRANVARLLRVPDVPAPPSGVLGRARRRLHS
jgi:hypothetical protein